MMINIKTTISFDTVKEREAIERFIRENNLEEWKESVFTTSTMFINEKTFYSVRSKK